MTHFFGCLASFLLASLMVALRRFTRRAALPSRLGRLRSGCTVLGLGLLCIGCWAQSAACGPSGAGAVCGGAGVATLGQSSGTALGAGNPVHLVSGNKHLSEIDLPALPGPLGLEIVRHYNSLHAVAHAPATPLGRGWRLSYDTQLAVIGSTVQVLQADGSRLMFRRHVDDPGLCAGDDPARGYLRAHTSQDGERFDWHWQDGRVLRFDVAGHLVQVSLPSGDHLQLWRDPQGRLLRAVDPQGREMRFLHGPEQGGSDHRPLVAIDTPAGRFEYRHAAEDPFALLAVKPPEAGSPRARKHYHYEDRRFAAHLTGVSLESTDARGEPQLQRVSTYAYDEAGRAKSTRRGEDSLRLDYSRPGQTTLTDGQGRVTIARHGVVGGEWRLLELVGSGCLGCGPAPMSLAYDGIGRLVRESALDAKGRVLRSRVTIRDAQGRVEAVALVESQTGLPAQPIWVERHRYEAGSPLPAESRFPSVVQGQDRVLRVLRNPAGQVLSLREAGFSPLDVQGRPLPSGLDGRVAARFAQLALPIEREIRLDYEPIAGRSRLIAMDGPLPNGPRGDSSDSDLTRVRWDARGERVVQVQQPGRAVSDIARHPGGEHPWPERVDTGRTQWSDEAQNAGVRHRASARGAPRLRHLFDDFGRPVARLSADHGDTSFGFDEADRLVWMRDASGRIARYGHDIAGRLIFQSMPTPGDAAEVTRWTRGEREHRVEHPLQSEQARFDALGRLTDRLIQVTPPMDGRHAHQGPTASAAATDPDRPEGGSASAVAVHLQWRHDLQGRLLAARLPDGSWLRYRRDGRGQVVALERERLGTPWLWGLLPAQVLVSDIERDRFDLSRLRTGNGHEVRWWRGPDGHLARLLHRRIAPAGRGQTALAGQPDADSPALPAFFAAAASAPPLDPGVSRPGFGLALAHAGPVPQAHPDARTGHPGHPGLPGWVGRPADAQALVDERYWWDTAGNLVLREDRSFGRAEAWRHLHDADDRLLMSRRLVARDAMPGHAALPSAGKEGAGGALPGLRLYRYDAQGRRVQAAEVAEVAVGSPGATGAEATSRLQVAPDSHRLVSVDGRSVTNDATGRPAHLGSHRFEWSATGQLLSVHRLAEPTAPLAERTVEPSEAVLARYAYNHRGERVWVQRGGEEGRVQLHDGRRRLADLDPQGRIQRQWVWLADLPVAVIDAPPGGQVRPLAQAAWASVLWRDIRLLARLLAGRADSISWLHTNHRGAPVAVTDHDARLRWQAEYTDFGRARVRSLDGFELDLRLPGQHEDAATGLHHNDHRVYHPDLGRYLTPDPLGTPDGPDPYAYVRHNPWRWVDPSGLVLWAFDGTMNAPDSRTNVWHFAQAYDDRSAYDRFAGIHGLSFYASGPGITVDASGRHGTSTSDAAMGHSMNATLDRQFAAFLSYAAGHWRWHFAQGARAAGAARIDLDVVGFSRGAAMSREFTHRVRDYLRSEGFRSQYGDCLSVIQRMLALFDTVQGVHVDLLGGPPLRMSIPDEVTYVFHAVAMNETRALFDLESIHRSVDDIGEGGPYRVERGFVGAHSDIGGGYNGTAPGSTGGDLSDLTLMWMTSMAQSAGVNMNALPQELTQVTSPVVHDESRAWLWQAVQYASLSSSRDVQFWQAAPPLPPPDPSVQDPAVSTGPVREPRSSVDQREVVWPWDMSSMRSLAFLSPRRPASSADRRVADVDLCRYVGWLNAQASAGEVGAVRFPVPVGC